MKIRAQFVSNSSSTSYIVLLPDNFKFTEEQITEIMNENCIEEEDIKEARNELDAFLKNCQATNYESKLYPGSIASVFTEMGLLITSINGGPDDVNFIKAIKPSKIERMIKKYENSQGIHK